MNSSPLKVARKAMEVSIRPTRKRIKQPSTPSMNKRIKLLPHCPGETQALPVSKMATMIPKLAGLNTCLPLIRIRNLLAMARAAAKASIQISFALRRRQSPSAVMSGLLRILIHPSGFWSCWGAYFLIKKSWVMRAVLIRVRKDVISASHPSSWIPSNKKEPRYMIW